MHKLKGIFSLVILLAISGPVTAQTISPYSALGIGDLYLPALPHSQGMGGIGISNSNLYFQSTLNPALLVDNGVYSFTAGFTSTRKTIKQNANREIASAGNLSHLNMVLPISQGNVSFSLGMMPYSDVNYNFRTSVDVVGDPSAEMEAFSQGSGGFNQFVFSTGVKINENFLVGGKVAYLFSSINTQINSYLESPPGIYVPTSITRTTARDFMYGFGAVYRTNLSNKIRLAVGTVYDFKRDITVERSQILQVETSSGTPISIDTVFDNTRGSIYIPEAYGFGLSLTNINKWTFGIDVRFQDWSDYKDFSGNNNVLVNTRLIAIGGEITPNIASVNNYFERITYRFGFNINDTPYFVNGQQIDEFGINFGLSLPVSNFSSVDLGFRYGNRGTLENNFIKEDFFQIFFGVTFNDNRWFVRPKFN